MIETDLGSYGDDHWMPYYLFCTPCLVKYDIIAKVLKRASETVNCSPDVKCLGNVMYKYVLKFLTKYYISVIILDYFRIPGMLINFAGGIVVARSGIRDH